MCIFPYKRTITTNELYRHCHPYINMCYSDITICCGCKKFREVLTVCQDGFANVGVMTDMDELLQMHLEMDKPDPNILLTFVVCYSCIGTNDFTLMNERMRSKDWRTIADSMYSDMVNDTHVKIARCMKLSGSGVELLYIPLYTNMLVTVNNLGNV